MILLSKLEERLKLKVILACTDSELKNTSKELLKKIPKENLFFVKREKVKESFKTERFPETWIINSKGYIVSRFDGQRDWLSPLFLDYLKRLR